MTIKRPKHRVYNLNYQTIYPGAKTVIPITQTKFTAKDGSINGNCLAACVASILECNLEEVPNIEDCPSDGSWFRLLWDFLKKRGYALKGSFHVKPGEPVSDWWPHLENNFKSIDGYCIITGESPREWVTRGHAVIYKDGVMVHDPHPSRAGLLAVNGALLIERD